MEFKAFPEIKQFGKMELCITQKIHGTNAHILIIPNSDGELELTCACRTRFVYPGQDNFGFAAWAHANKAELINLLGQGRHDGEWAGPGINSGEGLTSKTFVLFDHWRWPSERVRPQGVTVVPVLYRGQVDLAQVDLAMADLKANGSRLVPGFMRPEGIVISLAGTRYKKVFDREDTKWDQGSAGPKPPREPGMDYSHLCQPIRLEKLLSRDEKYLREFPGNLRGIVDDYFQDLVKESQVVGTEGEVAGIKKGAASQLFRFVKTIVEPLALGAQER